MVNLSKKRLNLGCGLDYKDGWINHDFNKEVKADYYFNLNEKIPFDNNIFSEIYIDNVMEHVENLLYLIDELYRISKPNCIITIYVPHFSGIYATKHITHYQQFGIGSFDAYLSKQLFNGERYGKARFNILEERLLYFHHNLINFSFLSKLPINWIFNFNKTWGIAVEKFLPLKFDEIKFTLKVIKLDGVNHALDAKEHQSEENFESDKTMATYPERHV